MAYMIVASECTGCTACEVECPNAAIKEKVPVFVIKAEKCSECIGFFDDPQCVEVCPVPTAIVINNEFPRYAVPA